MDIQQSFLNGPYKNFVNKDKNGQFNLTASKNRLRIFQSSSEIF